MRIKLFFDEDTQQTSLVNALRQHGVDVLTTFEAGRSAMPDSSQLEFATTSERTIYTFNIGDYMNLHVEYLTLGKTHAGIIFGEQDRFGIGEQMRRLLRIVEIMSAEEMRNEYQFLSRWQ